MSTSLLTYTALYPSSARPQHGIFIETRLSRLVANEGIRAQVVAPVPWFPSAHPRFGAWAKMASTPARDVRNGIEIHYPRYPLIPKMGMNSAPALQAWGSRAAMQFAVQKSAPKVLDAHYFFPDGVAAAAHAHALHLPLIISARGSDINLISQFATPRALMLRAAKEAHALIAVSTSLREAMIAIGMPAHKILVLRNGIDGERFCLRDQAQSRAAIGMPANTTRVIACVGNLVPEKGSDRVLEALIATPDTHAVFAGDGAMRAQLEARAREAGVAERVLFLGSVPQAQLVDVYNAADVLVLASLREGWPNVVLEAMACGAPVVASDVGAVREMIVNDSVGRVVSASSQPELNTAIADVLRMPVHREAVRAHALTYDWASVTRAQAALYADVAARQ